MALLAAIESLLSAVVADGMIGSRHKSNVELVGQGLANIGSGLCGGIPATGAIARTATNIKNGGRTPVAGMTHAVTVLAVLVFLGKWARFIPLATLAAVLAVVSYHMSEWRAFAHIFKTPKSDVAVLLTTFLLTVFIDLTVAVQVGVVLAAFLFIKRMADVTNVAAVTQELADAPDGTMIADAEGVARRTIPEGVEVYEVNGPFFFGAADKIKDVLHFVAKKPRVFILRMRNVPVLDASGIRVLDDLFQSFSHQGIRFVIAGIQAQPRAAAGARGPPGPLRPREHRGLAGRGARRGPRGPGRGGHGSQRARRGRRADAMKSWDGESLVSRRDAETGAWMFVALHSSRLGPSTGGTRMIPYAGSRGGAARRDAALRGHDVQVGRGRVSARRRQGRHRGAPGSGRPRRAPICCAATARSCRTSAAASGRAPTRAPRPRTWT